MSTVVGTRICNPLSGNIAEVVDGRLIVAPGAELIVSPGAIISWAHPKFMEITHKGLTVKWEKGNLVITNTTDRSIQA